MRVIGKRLNSDGNFANVRRGRIGDCSQFDRQLDLRSRIRVFGVSPTAIGGSSTTAACASIGSKNSAAVGSETGSGAIAGSDSARASVGSTRATGISSASLAGAGIRGAQRRDAPTRSSCSSILDTPAALTSVIMSVSPMRIASRRWRAGFGEFARR